MESSKIFFILVVIYFMGENRNGIQLSFFLFLVSEIKVHCFKPFFVLVFLQLLIVTSALVAAGI
jgi:hypothetical protein